MAVSTGAVKVCLSRIFQIDYQGWGRWFREPDSIWSEWRTSVKGKGARQYDRNRDVSLQRQAHWIPMPRYLTAQQFGRTMKLSLWAGLFMALPIYFVLEAGAFLIIGSVLKKNAGELVGSYLAFVLPALIFFPLVWWLRAWEEQGAPPKRLARGWVLSTLLFCLAVMVATFYSGIDLRLMRPNDALGGFVVAMLLAVPILYFSMYRRALRVISKRAAGKLDDARPK